MVFVTDGGGYGYPATGTSPEADPNRQQRATPTQTREQQTGEFTANLGFAPRVEAGNTVRFTATFQHIKDGLLGAGNNFASGPTVLIKDANGNTVGSGATGVTQPNGVLQDPGSSGNFYAQVEFGSSITPGPYSVEWSGTYTPAGQTQPLTLKFRQQFSVEATQAKPSIWLRNTASF